MRNAKRTTILLALPGLTAVAALALLATSVHSRVPADDDSRRSRLVSHDDAWPARAAGPRVGRAVPVPAIPTPDTIGAAERLFINGVTKDFGTVRRGAQLLHRFPIANSYAFPITIAYLQASCGCLTASAAQHILQPHERATIDVRMDAGRFTGPSEQSVRVKIVGPHFESTCKLRVFAVSQSDIVLEPGQLNFGNVAHGQLSTQAVDVEYAGTRDWQVTEVVVAKELPFAVMLSDPYRRPGRVGYRLKVTLKADAPAGTIRNYIDLKTNDPGDQVVRVPVVAIVRQPLIVAPDVLSLGIVKVGEVLTRRLLVRGDKPFHVTGLEGLGDGFTLDVEPLKTAAAVQTVKFRCAFAKVGDFKRQLKIKTDLPDGPVTVTIEGTVASEK
jgi:hypothetical protein